MRREEGVGVADAGAHGALRRGLELAARAGDDAAGVMVSRWWACLERGAYSFLNILGVCVCVGWWWVGWSGIEGEDVDARPAEGLCVMAAV